MSKSSVAPVSATADPDTLDYATALQEVITKRKAEAQQLKSELETWRAKITSERVQWTTQQEDEVMALKHRADALEETYRTRQAQVDEAARQAQIHLQTQRALEAAAEQQVIEANRRVEELNVLAQERVEIQTLRQQVTALQQAAEERMAQGQQMLSQGQDALAQAERLAAETQRRTLALNDRDAAVTGREDAALLREHQVEKVEAVLNQRLAALAPSPAQETAAGESQEPVLEGVAA
mgnify:CR=1 FL=1